MLAFLIYNPIVIFVQMITQFLKGLVTGMKCLPLLFFGYEIQALQCLFPFCIIFLPFSGELTLFLQHYVVTDVGNPRGAF